MFPSGVPGTPVPGAVTFGGGKVQEVLKGEKPVIIAGDTYIARFWNKLIL